MARRDAEELLNRLVRARRDVREKLKLAEIRLEVSSLQGLELSSLTLEEQSALSLLGIVDGNEASRALAEVETLRAALSGLEKIEASVEQKRGKT